jgi:hypothetical protein
MTPTELGERLRLIPSSSPTEVRTASVEGARLFANRYDLIAALDLPPQPAVCEVGVAIGDFSAFLVELLNPSHFTAIDIFTMHELKEFWGVPREKVMGKLPHLQFFLQRFAALGNRLTVLEGDSAITMARMEDATQDLIYIDANHDYEPVKRETEHAVRKLKDDGIIVFNDYIMYDHWAKIPYGVVQAVNELLAGGGWYVAGFALNHSMFCDIAVARRPAALKDLQR